MSNVCLLGSWPLIKPAALLNQSLLLDLAIVPITALASSMLGSPQPPLLLRPHLLPLLPFLFDTPSAVLSSSLWAWPKNRQSSSPVRTSCPQSWSRRPGRCDPSGELLFWSSEERWRWFPLRFTVYHSLDFLTYYLPIEVTTIRACCDYFPPEVSINFLCLSRL